MTRTDSGLMSLKTKAQGVRLVRFSCRANPLLGLLHPGLDLLFELRIVGLSHDLQARHDDPRRPCRQEPNLHEKVDFPIARSRAGTRGDPRLLPLRKSPWAGPESNSRRYRRPEDQDPESPADAVDRPWRERADPDQVVRPVAKPPGVVSCRIEARLDYALNLPQGRRARALTGATALC